MEKVTNNKFLSIVSFVIFLIGILKYYLINIREIIHPYSPLNRTISWMIFPFVIMGILISLFVIFKEIKSTKASFVNILLSIPLIVYFIYFFFII